MPQEVSKPDVELAGQVVRFVYQSDDQSYSVARLQPDSGGEQITLAGPLFGLREGAPVVVRGTFLDHPRVCRQLKVTSIELKLPTTAQGIRAYLEHVGVKGVGKGLSKRLVDAFGERTVEVLDQEPEEVMRVLGKKRGTD